MNPRIKYPIIALSALIIFSAMTVELVYPWMNYVALVSGVISGMSAIFMTLTMRPPSLVVWDWSDAALPSWAMRCLFGLTIVTGAVYTVTTVASTVISSHSPLMIWVALTILGVVSFVVVHMYAKRAQYWK